MLTSHALVIFGYLGFWFVQVSCFSFPLKISVFISEFESIVDHKLFEKVLYDILPTHELPIEDELSELVHFKLEYDVKPLSISFCRAYEALILNSQNTEGGHRVILVAEVLQLLSEFHSSLPFNDIFEISFILMHAKSLAPHRIESAGVTSRFCTQSVIGSVAFMDLSAASCDLSSAITPTENTHIRWSTPLSDDPAPFVFAPISQSPWPSVSVDVSRFARGQLLARLAGVVSSGIEALASSNLQLRNAHSSSKIFIPLVFLKNSNNSLTGSLDSRLLTEWVQSLLVTPSQDVIVLSTTHFVDEHPLISVALAAAMSSHPSHLLPDAHQVPFIDSSIFLRELKASQGDELLEQLLSKSGYESEISEALRVEAAEEALASGAAKRSSVLEWLHGRRLSSSSRIQAVSILPVFIISDLNFHVDASGSPPMQPLLDRVSRVTVEDGVVLALHSSVPVSTQSLGQQAEVETLPSAISLVASGLSQAIAGLVAPHHRVKRGHSRGDLLSDISYDLTWTHGQHPFEYFGQTTFKDTDLNINFRSNQIAASARRGMLLSRCVDAVLRYDLLETRIASLVKQVVQSIMLLEGSSISDAERPNESPSNESSIEDLLHPIGVFRTAAKISKYLPENLVNILVKIEDEKFELEAKISSLKGSLMLANLNDILLQLTVLEGQLLRMEGNVGGWETFVEAQLSPCVVVFDEDPAVSQRKLNRSARAVIHDLIWTSLTGILSRFAPLFILLGVLTVGGIGLSVKMILDSLESRAKKVR